MRGCTVGLDFARSVIMHKRRKSGDVVLDLWGWNVFKGFRGLASLSNARKRWNSFSTSPLWQGRQIQALFLLNKGAAMPQAQSNLKYQIS